MVVSYEQIIGDFLTKVTEYRLLNLPKSSRDAIVISYLKKAVMDFSNTCREKVVGFDDEAETVEMENAIDEVEFCNIISDGMVYYWFYPAMHNQAILENTLNSADFSSYSPAELLKQVRAAYADCTRKYTNRLRQYSYDHGDLTDLHL